MGKGNDPNCVAGAVAMAVCEPVIADARAEQARRRFSLGHLTGHPADYDRKALCRILSLQAADAAGLSDDDLRSMALDGGLICPGPGAPAHIVLADRWVASREPLSDAQRDKAHASAVSCGYDDLARLVGYDHDGERYDPPTSQQHRSAWDLRLGDGMRSFLAERGGAHLTTITSTGGVAWGRRVAHVQLPAGTRGFYGARSGAVMLSPQAEKTLRRALKGQADQWELSLTCEMLAHEAQHAMGGGNGSGKGEHLYAPDGPAAHGTLEEGVAVLGSERDADALARALGLWDADEPLPHADRDDVAYPFEREAVSVIAHLCSGQLHADSITDGAYGRPQHWHDEAVAGLCAAHRAHERHEDRVEALASDLARASGRPVAHARALISRLLDDCPRSGVTYIPAELDAHRARMRAAVTDHGFA